MQLIAVLSVSEISSRKSTVWANNVVKELRLKEAVDFLYLFFEFFRVAIILIIEVGRILLKRSSYVVALFEQTLSFLIVILNSFLVLIYFLSYISFASKVNCYWLKVLS